MLALLPGLTFLALLAVLRTRAPHADWRDSYLAAAVLIGVYLTAATEVLSVLHALHATALVCVWTLPCALLTVWLIRKRTDWSTSLLPRGCRRAESMIVLTIVGIVGLIAMIAPPNNWDSMTYHMARVAHWKQNATVAFYPTHIMRQLHPPPGSEYALAHVFILGGDRFVNLVQGFAFAAAAVAASRLADHLGAPAPAQWLAAMLVLTTPMAILQGSSTQNDLVAAMWVAIFVTFGTRWLSDRRFVSLMLGAGALGLALLTKGTSYVFAAPFVIGFGAAIIRHRGLRAWRPLVATVAIVVALNAGHYARNAGLYGHPLGPATGRDADEKVKYTNDIVTPLSVASTIVRNVASHFMSTPLRPVNRLAHAVTVALHERTGCDVSDPRTTFGLPFAIPRSWRHEDSIGNPLHLLIGAVALALFIRRRREIPNARNLAAFVAACAAAALLFCVLFRWQMWSTRLHLPLFVLGSAFAASALPPGATRLRFAVLAVVLVGAVPCLVYNKSRPIVGEGSILTTPRTELYFSNRRDLYAPYQDAAARVRAAGVTEIGLIAGSDDWAYPLFALLGPGVRIVHVDVENASRTLPGARLHGSLDVIACLDPARTSQLSTDRDYALWAAFDRISLFRRR